MLALSLALVVLLDASSTPAPSPAPPPAPSAAEAASVRDAVRVLVDALNRHDFGALASRLAPDFTYAGRGGDLGRTILRQVVAGYPKTIARHRVERVQATATGFSALVVFEAADGGVESHEVLLGPELTLLKAEVAKIQLAPHSPAAAVAGSVGPADRVPDRLEVPFELVHGLIVVEASVAGRRGRFVVDSGAPQALVLNSDHRVDLARTASPTGLHGASGQIEQARSGRLRDFQWQGLELGDLEAGFAPLGHLEDSIGVTPLAGLIGFGVLERFRVEYDYPGRRLVLVRLDPNGDPVAPVGPPPEATVPLQMVHHVPVLTVTLGGQALRLGVDSGAEVGLLRARWRSPLADRMEVVGTDELTAADAHPRTVEKVRLPRLEVGGLVYAGLTFTVADLQFGHEVEIDGLLGCEFLSQRRVAFNFRRGEAYLGRQRGDGR